MSTAPDDPQPGKTRLGSSIRRSPVWLAKQVREEILEPERPIIDPHHHLWDRGDDRYLLDELLADTQSGHRITATVFVECTAFYRADGPPELRPVGETEAVNGVAAMSASGGYGAMRACAGIVGFADLTLGEAVRPALEAHLRAGGGRFRGIRHAGGWDASPEIRNSHTHPPRNVYADARFRQGFAQLADLGLSFDAWQYHTQLSEVTALAQAFPQVTMVLDHCGGPLGIGPYAGRRDETFAHWRRDLLGLARCPNVVVKLGGLGMRIGMFDFHAQDTPPDSATLARAWRPWIETCIEAFGAQRCMFESNFPVDAMTTGYGVLWNAFKRLAAGASQDEKAALFSGTATRVYRL